MKGILFNTKMVQAILGGKKSCTRRNPFHFQFRNGRNPNFSGYSLGEYCTGKIDSGAVLYSRRGDGGWEQVTERVKPKYKVGDILYVRETFNSDCLDYGDPIIYKADFTEGESQAFYHDCTDFKWRPSIHMPKSAARIFLEVTDVRVERLQDITSVGAEMEGVSQTSFWKPHDMDDRPFEEKWWDDYYFWGHYPQIAFSNLWNSTIKKQDLDKYSWQANPFVWVYKFKRIDKSEDTDG